MAQRILRRPAVEAITGDCKSGLYAKSAAGLFPSPIKIGPRASGWPENEVSAVQAARIAGKTEIEIRELVKRLHAARAEVAV